LRLFAEFDLTRSWLVKQGEKVKNWKKRYFVLVDVPAPTLYYFAKEDSLQARRTEKKKKKKKKKKTQKKSFCLQQESGKVHLDLTTPARPTYTSDKKHMLELVTPTRTFNIYHEESTQVDAWIEAINGLTGRKLRSLSDPEAPVDDVFASDTPLSNLIQNTLKACKDFYPALGQVINLANKYQSRVSSVVEVGKSLADLMYHIGAGGTVETDTGKELCKIATALKLIETRKDELRSAYIDHFVVKFQKTIEEESKGLEQLERAIKAKSLAVGKELGKARAALTKAQKKNNPDQLNQAKAAFDQRQAQERAALEECLKQLLQYQETRQRALLISWTEAIGSLEKCVDAELKLVQSNTRWRSESQRPVNPQIPNDISSFPSPPQSNPNFNTVMPAYSSGAAQTAFKLEELPDSPRDSGGVQPSGYATSAGGSGMIPPPMAPGLDGGSGFKMKASLVPLNSGAQFPPVGATSGGAFAAPPPMGMPPPGNMMGGGGFPTPPGGGGGDAPIVSAGVPPPPPPMFG
jgi:hypothetical protein